MTRSGMFCKMWFIAFAAMIALSGCNGFNSQSSDISLQDMGPAEIYQKGEFELSKNKNKRAAEYFGCLLYTSPSPRDATLSRMPSSA